MNTVEAEAHINTLIYGTNDPTKTIILEMKSLLTLYRKFPTSFKNSDELATKVEEILFNPKPT